MSTEEQMYIKLHEAYTKAKKDGREQFDFMGQPCVTNYIKYRLEYTASIRPQWKEFQRSMK